MQDDPRTDAEIAEDENLTTQPVAALILPGVMTPTSLTLPEGLSFADWEQAGALLQRIEGAVRWWVGDWLNFGERRYGEAYSQAILETGLAERSITNAQWVAGKIEPTRRRVDLSWSHHSEVAALEPAEQDRMLAAAADKGWNQKALRQAVKKATPDTPLDPGVCKCCQGTGRC